MLTLCTRGDFVIKLISKYKVIALITLLIIVNFLFIFGQTLVPKQDEVHVQLQQAQDQDLHTEQLTQTLSTVPTSIVLEEVPIYVCGAVNQPGVYHVKLPSIIQDVITLAGGMRSDADQDALNLAAPLVGNSRIYVPLEGELLSEIPSMESTSKQTGKININTADQNTLESLPGIGPAKATQIIEYRQSYGSFKTIETLQDVSGIGTKTFDGLKDLISIE